MGRLLLVRHGESEGNRDGVFTRTSEVPLTDEGRTQVLATARWIASRYAPVEVVSSPFTRARQTAEIIAGVLGATLAVEEDLRERSYGTLAGQPYAAARGLAGYERSSWWAWCPPEGETLVDVVARAGAVLDRVATAAPDRDVVIVSHGAVMMALWRHMTGSWGERRVVPNAGVVVVEHRGGSYLSAHIADDVHG
jgi:broad specificity phosphatase PhoE